MNTGNGPTFARSSTDASQTRRVYLLTNPRTASNLMVRVLNLENQPRVLPAKDHGGYFFKQAEDVRSKLENWHKHVDDLSSTERVSMTQVYQQCANDFEKFLEEADVDSKMVFVKEHLSFMVNPTAISELLGVDRTTKEVPWTVSLSRPSGNSHSELNPTLLSDEFLLTWQPVFLIRHPALTIPSLFRAYGDIGPIDDSACEAAEMRVKTTFRFSRQLFDWYVGRFEQPSKQEGFRPIVIDAVDAINDQQLVRKFAEMVGLDTNRLIFNWSKVSQQDGGKIGDVVSERMRSTIDSSTGIIKTKAPQDLDISAEANAWRDEFGQEHAQLIETWVREAMPDYEYLRSRRLQVV